MKTANVESENDVSRGGGGQKRTNKCHDLFELPVMRLLRGNPMKEI